MVNGRPSGENSETQRLLEERTADLQRVKAEYDNYRKRVRRDRMAVREIAVANVLTALLPVLDAVDRTCRHEPMTPGLKDIATTLETQLATLGVQTIGEEGEAFDPTRHEALAHHVAPDADRPICTEILRPGYRTGERLLRPAQVEVAGPPQPERGRRPADDERGHRDTAEGGSEPYRLTRAGPDDPDRGRP